MNDPRIPIMGPDVNPGTYWFSVNGTAVNDVTPRQLFALVTLFVNKLDELGYGQEDSCKPSNVTDL